jgi:hypothetical protein
VALIATLFAAAVHGWAMIQLLPEGHAPAAAGERPLGVSVRLALGFVANFAFAGLGSFVATATGQPIARSIASGWPYGVLLLAGLAALVLWSLRRWRAERTPQTRISLVVVAFSAAGFVMLIGLAAAREFGAAATAGALANQLALYTTVPRYVIPLHFLMAGGVVLVLLQLARRWPRASAPLFAGFTLAAVAAQIDFQSSAHKYVRPLSAISHASPWKLILATVQECRAARLPVPNVPLGTLTQEFHDIDPRMFETLVRRDLRLSRDEQIELIPWEEYLAGREQWSAAVPSLPLLERKLRLNRE